MRRLAPGSNSVRSALARYREENACAAAGEPLHDLHHLATGYGTDRIGEGEMSAFELGAGVPLRALLLRGLLTCLLLAPLRAVRAFRLGRRCRSLYDRALPYPRLVELTVAELRAHIGLPAHGPGR